jgi:hypothetical protein
VAKIAVTHLSVALTVIVRMPAIRVIDIVMKFSKVLVRG